MCNIFYQNDENFKFSSISLVLDLLRGLQVTSEHFLFPHLENFLFPHLENVLFPYLENVLFPHLENFLFPILPLLLFRVLPECFISLYLMIYLFSFSQLITVLVHNLACLSFCPCAQYIIKPPHIHFRVYIPGVLCS